MKPNLSVYVSRHLFIGCAQPAPVPKHIYFTILLEYSQKASKYSCVLLIMITDNFNHNGRKVLFWSQNKVGMGGRRGLSVVTHMWILGRLASLLYADYYNCCCPTSASNTVSAPTAASVQLPLRRSPSCPNYNTSSPTPLCPSELNEPHFPYRQTPLTTASKTSKDPQALR